MPAILLGMQRDSPGASAGNPGPYRGGEITGAFAEDTRFGFTQMPVNAQGSFTVAQVNGIDVTTLPPYAAVKLLDSGTITSGTGEDVEVVTDDVIVLYNDDSWDNFGPRTDVPDIFFHIRISDRTLEETQIYLERFNKKFSYQSDQYRPSDDLRRWTTTNIRVSASGNNGLTEQGIIDNLDLWNERYPDNTVTLVDTDNLTYFQCEGTMPNEMYETWQNHTLGLGLQSNYLRRRWYINQAGMTALENNGWLLNGPASEVAQFLRDGLLD